MSVPKASRTSAVGVEDISRAILVVRGHKMLLDGELAALYGVDTRVLLQAVKRNRERFPTDFMIQLTAAEWAALRSQIVTLKRGRGQHRKYLPYAFTEQGVAMLSSVLKSARAIAVNIQIMRAFVRMRELLISNRELAQKLDQLEARLEKKLASHDEAIAAILSAIRELMNPETPKHRSIGFTADLDEK
jgi:ORF6N domain-containing protein